MTFSELFAIAVALAMDAFAVAVCAGCGLRRVTLGHYARLALTFGFFQFLMPVLGWGLGHSVRVYIETWDHWVAFALLAWIGVSMFRSGLSNEACPTGDPSRGMQLLVLAVATSIDALAVGLSFALIGMDVWTPSLLIGVVCAVITALGVWLGRRLAHADIFGRRAELVGGLVLIGIGAKILYEHGVFCVV